MKEDEEEMHSCSRMMVRKRRKTKDMHVWRKCTAWCRREVVLHGAEEKEDEGHARLKSYRMVQAVGGHARAEEKEEQGHARAGGEGWRKLSKENTPAFEGVEGREDMMFYQNP